MKIQSLLRSEQIHLRQVYQRIIILALLVHAIYAACFYMLDIELLTYYHLCSIIFYCFMLLCVHKERFRLTVALVHFEVTLFVIINTLVCGWEAGFALYLIAIATLVYFCPFNNPFIPYLFSILELLTFFLIKFYFVEHFPSIVSLSNSDYSFLYFLNAISAFTIILYAALITNVSSATTKRVLLKDNEDLKDMAEHDHLTTLLNRHFLQNKIQTLNLEDTQISVIIGDIDDFKYINDHYGHSCGDYILQTISLIIKTHIGEDGDVCRWGGEEFLIILYGSDTVEAFERINMLCKTIYDYHFIYNLHTMHLTMTFGIANSNENKDVNKLIDLADFRLYSGKKNGKNRVINHD